MPPVTDGTFAPPPNSHVEILTPDIVVSEAGLGETTTARGRVLTNGVSALNKGTRARAFSVPCEGTVRWPRGTQEEGLHPEADHAATFTSRLQKCGKCLFVFEPLSVVIYCGQEDATSSTKSSFAAARVHHPRFQILRLTLSHLPCGDHDPFCQ